MSTIKAALPTSSRIALIHCGLFAAIVVVASPQAASVFALAFRLLIAAAVFPVATGIALVAATRFFLWLGMERAPAPTSGLPPCTANEKAIGYVALAIILVTLPLVVSLISRGSLAAGLAGSIIAGLSHGIGHFNEPATRFDLRQASEHRVRMIGTERPSA